MSINNSLVAFIRHYGPIAAADNMYDELIQAEIERHNIEPVIQIPPAIISQLLDNFGGDSPRSVILTGTAGDGKTFHCRQVWSELGGDLEIWRQGSKRIKLKLPSSHKNLHIIKDLSELTKEEKDSLLTELAASISGIDVNNIFLVAANDGQLLASWREWSEKNDGHGHHIFRAIENMLIDGYEKSDDYFLDIFNLSRLDASGHFEALVKEVIEHPQWSQCDGCTLMPVGGKSSACPIRINREFLRATNGKSLFVKRLSDLIKLASSNRMHVPIRDLLLLVVNILLGDQKGNRILLTCRTARNRANEGEYHLTNPYANVFGANLSARLRSQYQVFNVLESFGIGRETDNWFDDLLIYGAYSQQEAYREFISNDKYYGAAAYRQYLSDYLDGERENIESFSIALIRQRQRLFFSLPADKRYDPWRLSVYQSSGLFLDFIQRIEEKRDTSKITRLLIRGLNRTFTGMMIDDDAQLYLASSGGDGRGRVASLFNYKLSMRRGRRNPYLSFILAPDGKAPRLSIVDPVDDSVIDSLVLRLTHFEYLVRVSNGSLPTSFSLQCNEDFLDFKLRVIKKLNEVMEEEPFENEIDLNIIKINEQGQVVTEPIPIQIGVD